ncbi:uncharacterized protein LOC108044299 [Drosophila rhopaloa]|uniref:Uncharacterized protein LOC108044299 n=1 Tax=Drosophila rhopaloa TaxID=1041015 RepID=A0A6P4EUK2_DRORH|nr:uncharacterized protein LOC108044299 [Drosophila rhopaloa]
MDGGGDNQLAMQSLRSRRRSRAFFPYYAGAARETHEGPVPAQGDEVALQMAIHALILAELAEDSGFESGDESG